MKIRDRLLWAGILVMAGLSIVLLVDQANIRERYAHLNEQSHFAYEFRYWWTEFPSWFNEDQRSFIEMSTALAENSPTEQVLRVTEMAAAQATQTAWAMADTVIATQIPVAQTAQALAHQALEVMQTPNQAAATALALSSNVNTTLIAQADAVVIQQTSQALQLGSLQTALPEAVAIQATVHANQAATAVSTQLTAVYQTFATLSARQDATLTAVIAQNERLLTAEAKAQDSQAELDSQLTTQVALATQMSAAEAQRNLLLGITPTATPTAPPTPLASDIVIAPEVLLQHIDSPAVHLSLNYPRGWRASESASALSLLPSNLSVTISVAILLGDRIPHDQTPLEKARSGATDSMYRQEIREFTISGRPAAVLIEDNTSYFAYSLYVDYGHPDSIAVFYGMCFSGSKRECETNFNLMLAIADSAVRLP